MAIAAWLVWRQSGFVSIPLAIFALQLILNAAWSWLFFGLQNPGIAFIEILFLWTVIAATIMMFWQKSALAGLLLVPYLCWVAFACFLNFTIWRMNA
jgi:tryptophan-rich sensory protein